jgi:CMP-N,N'-diacetyllegionaminic acid synthase
MKILVTVAARAGSKGVRKKNIRDLAGKPLILYTIEQVIQWGNFEKFIVSTDSKKIADIAVRGGAEVPFLRPAELATDDCGKADVLRHALIESEKHYGMTFDALLDLDATSPIRTVEDIENIVRLFKEKKPDCVFSVVRARKNPYFNMVEVGEDGLATLCKRPPRQIRNRQTAPKVYEMNASLYIYDRDFLSGRENAMPYSKRAMIYEMAESSAIDIDNEMDFRFIEFLLKEGKVKL